MELSLAHVTWEKVSESQKQKPRAGQREHRNAGEDASEVEILLEISGDEYADASGEAVGRIAQANGCRAAAGFKQIAYDCQLADPTQRAEEREQPNAYAQNREM